MYLADPLEQFQILPLISIRILNFDFSYNNSALIVCIALCSFFMVMRSLLSKNDENFLIIPSRWQIIIETLYLTVANMLYDNLGKKGSVYVPFIWTLFIYVLLANLIGLIPYSFTATSHLIVTFALACLIFIGVNIIGSRIHGFNFLSILYPPNTALVLGLLLVPIEMVSHFFKPISLGVRLFANMMAGHTLLKVIGGFAWSMMTVGGFLLYLHVIPLIILTLLIGLELGVAIIQSYVFTILSCIYLSDSINLH